MGKLFFHVLNPEPFGAPSCYDESLFVDLDINADVAQLKRAIETKYGIHFSDIKIMDSNGETYSFNDPVIDIVKASYQMIPYVVVKVANVAPPIKTRRTVFQPIYHIPPGQIYPIALRFQNVPSVKGEFIHIQNNMTVGEFKKLLADRYDIPADKITLLSKNEVIDDNEDLPTVSHISKEPLIIVVDRVYLESQKSRYQPIYRLAAGEKTMVNVRPNGIPNLTPQYFPIVIGQNMTVGEFKTLFGKTYNVPPNRLVLISSGHVIFDDGVDLPTIVKVDGGSIDIVYR